MWNVDFHTGWFQGCVSVCLALLQTQVRNAARCAPVLHTQARNAARCASVLHTQARNAARCAPVLQTQVRNAARCASVLHTQARNAARCAPVVQTQARNAARCAPVVLLCIAWRTLGRGAEIRHILGDCTVGCSQTYRLCSGSQKQRIILRNCSAATTVSPVI
jgi:putative hemolysin